MSSELIIPYEIFDSLSLFLWRPDRFDFYLESATEGFIWDRRWLLASLCFREIVKGVFIDYSESTESSVI